MGIADETDATGDVHRLSAARSSRELFVSPLGYRVFGSRTARSASLEIDHLAYGVLTSAMMVDDSDVADLTAFNDPHLSGGLAFLMGRDLATPPGSVDEAIEAVELIFPAIDIGGRSYADSALNYGDIADTDGVGGYVIIGDGGRAPSEIDLACCGAVLEADGEFAGSGAGAAVLGHPARTLVWLARALGDVGDTLKAGAMVVVGEITASIPVTSRHHARLAIGGLGSASVRFR